VQYPGRADGYLDRRAPRRAFVRILFLVLLVLLIFKLSYDIFSSKFLNDNKP